MSQENPKKEYPAYLAEIWKKFLENSKKFGLWVKKVSLKAIVVTGVCGKMLAQKTIQYTSQGAKWLRDVGHILSVKTKHGLNRLWTALQAVWKKIRGWVDQITLAKTALPKEPVELTEEAPVVHEIPQPVAAPVKAAKQPQTQVVEVHQTADRAMGFRMFWRKFKGIVWWIWRLRGLLLALPIFWTALKLALENRSRLPEQVGINIQASGEFAQTISRDLAVYGPLGVTAFCLVLAAISRKPLVPLMIGVFSLILPALIWLTNYYA